MQKALGLLFHSEIGAAAAAPGGKGTPSHPGFENRALHPDWLALAPPLQAGAHRHPALPRHSPPSPGLGVLRPTENMRGQITSPPLPCSQVLFLGHPAVTDLVNCNGCLLAVLQKK